MRYSPRAQDARRRSVALQSEAGGRPSMGVLEITFTALHEKARVWMLLIGSTFNHFALRNEWRDANLAKVAKTS
jgi:hypothetical protein